MTLFGNPAVWAIEVEPLAGPPSEPDPAAAATWTALRLWAGGQNLTAHTRTDSMTASSALHWPAAFLARWFLGVWDDLWSRAGWPLPGSLVDPEAACTRLDAYLAQEDESIDDEFLERRDAFVRSHTLLAAAAGGVMPHVYLMREGRLVHVVWRDPETRNAPVRFHAPRGWVRVGVPLFLDSVSAFMRWCRDEVGDRAPNLKSAINDWLESIKNKSAASSVLKGYVHPWGARGSGASVADLEGTLDLPKEWGASGALLDVERIPAAVVYRSLAPVIEAPDVAVILARLRNCPARPEGAEQVRQLAAVLSMLPSDLPHEQGYQLAEQVRTHWGNRDQKLDIEAVFRDLHLDIQEADLSDDSVDAVTTWDERHGPVVILNERSRRNPSWARRMSLAHELCHLLVDRGQAAALMIASTPWAPPEIERRANAFAAEMLLPRAGILRCLGERRRFGWITEEERQQLMTEFGVGDTVCRHQTENRLRLRTDD